MKKLVVLAILLCISPVFAEEKDSDEGVFNEGRNNYIGFSASYLSGAGLSYMREWTPGFRTRFSGLYYVNKKTNSGITKEEKYADGGGEIQYDLFRFGRDRWKTSYFRGYILGGGAYWFMRTRKYDYDQGRYRIRNKKSYSAGGGFGFGYVARSWVAFDVSVTYQLTKSRTSSDEYTGPRCGASVSFMF